MKCMHKCTLWLVLSALFFAQGFALANTNIVWDFSAPADYTHSHPLLTEVDGTNAQLVLQAQTIYHNSQTNYQNASSIDDLVLGYDASIELSGGPGSYTDLGVFVSRIFESDINNVWEHLVVGGGNSSLLYDNTVMYWFPLDYNWIDVASDASATLYPSAAAGPVLRPESPITTHSAYFDGSASYFSLVNAMAATEKMTVSFWVKADTTESEYAYYPFSLRYSANDFAIKVGGTLNSANYDPGSIGIWHNAQGSFTVGNTFTDATDANVWRHIVVTYDGAANTTAIYKDAVLQPMFSQNASGDVRAHNAVFVGRRSTGGACWEGLIDDVLVWNRILQPDEISRIFTRRSRYMSPIKMQIRGGNTTNELLLNDFVGFDGTTNSFYINDTLSSSAAFDVTNRFVQYKAHLYSDVNRDFTPLLSHVTFKGDNSTRFDTMSVDYMEGSNDTDIAINPSSSPTPYLGLAHIKNGGYPASGDYFSRVLDSGSALSQWGNIIWAETEALTAETGMSGLYHFDNSSSPDTYGPFAASANNTWTDYAKFGGGSAVFDGSQQIDYNFAPVTEVQAVEFWVSIDNPDGGLLEISTTDTNASGNISAFVTIDDRKVNVHGMEDVGKYGRVYVNASPYQHGLLSGWNHVAIVFDRALDASGFSVGTANGQFLEGKMDELVLYEGNLSAGEIAAHFVTGKHSVAGRVSHVDVRTGDSLPLTNAFVGPYNNGDSVNIINRYLQYRLVLESDGSGTPAVESIRVAYDSGSFLDDTADEINQGSFSGTAWYGDEVKLLDQAQVDADINDASARGVWHFDENWDDSTFPAEVATPAGETTFAPAPRLGIACATLDGDSDFITLGSHNLNSDPFTFSMWFKTTMTTSAPLISASDASGFWQAEINSDGAGSVVTGQVALIVNDGATTHTLASRRRYLNDGQWHNIIGLRDGEMIHLYIDGERDVSAICGSGFGDVGGGETYVGTTAAFAQYYEGKVDEISIWDRALTEAEVGNYYAGGYWSKGSGIFVSEVLDNNGDPSIWQDLSWVTDGRYGCAMEDGGSPALEALWLMDDNLYTDEVAGNDGVAGGSPATNAAGKFNGCVELRAGDSLTIADPNVLNPANVTIEAWVNMASTASKLVFDKHDNPMGAGGDGYVLATDASGNPFFKVDDAVATSYMPVRADKWTHLAGTYDGSKVRIYMDGQIVAVTTAAGRTPVASPTETAVIGAGSFDGYIDQVAVHSRALGSVELQSHYKAGALFLGFQAQTDAQSHVGPGGSTGTYWYESTGVDMQGSVNLGRNFTYKATLRSGDHRMTPHLHGIEVYVANYPVNDPQVYPVNPIYTPGRLYGFTDTVHRISATADVEYQISWNGGLNWYYWLGGTNNYWQEETGLGYQLETSTETEIDTYINRFYDQLVEPNKTGIDLMFKAYLHSDGAYQIQVDDITIPASEGRILVESPNGTESNNAAWIVSVPQVITWSSDGNVSDNLTIELWQGAAMLKVLTNGYPNIGSWTGIVHDTAAADYRIRIHDANDATIYDMSDEYFELRYGYHLIAPDGGELWKIGTTNDLVWQHPSPKLNDFVDFWFSYDGLTNYSAWHKVANAVSIANPIGAENTYAWLNPTNDWRFVSENAAMAVVAANMPHPLAGDITDIETRDFSDVTFTNAGIAIMYPQAGTGVKNGNSIDVTWAAAGVGNGGVHIELWDGLSWSTLVTNNVCVPGTNNSANVPIVGQTEEALIRITSIDHPDLVGVSFAFTIADIDIIEPFGGAGSRSLWEIGTTNIIQWTAGGAGSNVNVRFTCDEMGGVWQYIATNYPNINSTTFTNTLPWTIPGPPSKSVRLRVESTTQLDLYAETDPAGFSMLGLLLNLPDRDSDWPLTGNSNTVEWLNVGGSGNVFIDVSYDSGTSWEPVTNVYSLNAATNTFDITSGMLRRPSERARIRLTQPSTVLGHQFDAEMDENFLIRGIAMHSPSNGVTVNLGSNVVDALQWYSARTDDPVVQLYYSSDNGANYNDEIFRDSGNIFNNIDDGDSWNSYAWPIALNLKPSVNARVKVVTDTGYEAESEAFTLRGVRVTVPAEGEKVDIGSTVLVEWDYADVFGSAQASNYVSITGMTGSFAKYGFTNNAQINFGSVNWTIPSDITPTTNAVIMMDVYDPPADADVTAYSLPFTIAGIKILSPDTGTNWWGGTSQNISFVAAGLNPGARADIYYSSDGTFSADDLAKPVVQNLPVGNGSNNYNWNIENSSLLTRLPSTNARIRVVSGTYESDSQPFTLSGIKVTRPRDGDVWAVKDGTNTIEWTGVGISGNYSLSYTVLTGANPVLTYPYSEVINPNVLNTGQDITYDWTMVSNSIGSDVIISITGDAYSNDSELFEIVAQPSVRFISPKPGDFLKVTTTSTVQWVRGGSMVDNFELWVTYSDNSSSRLGSSGGGEITLADGVYSYEWADIPNRLGITALTATNLADSTIVDTVSNFNIAAKFNIPDFTTDLYALKLYNVYFTTKGSVSSGVDFYYTTDETRDPASWVHINPGSPFPVSHNETKFYDWTVADARDPSVYLRIQDHSYTQAFDAAIDGPFDDYGPFPINYYRVVWEVYDAELYPSNIVDAVLDNLSMSDNLGFSSASLSSPFVHYYPYGSWDTLWFREYFHDNALLGWVPSEDLTNVVVMERSQIEPDYHVMANFSYDSSVDTLMMNSWLERGGTIADGSTNCTIKIYDASGSGITNISSSSPQNGVFWQSWDVSGKGYSPTDVFFARVEITYSGIKYSSGLTFMLRLTPTSEEIGEVIELKSSFSYNEAATNFTVISWLDRSGAILTSSSNCVVDISEAVSGTPLATLSSAAPSSGLFQQVWTVPGTYTEDDVFLARMEIEYLGKLYSDATTFRMVLTATDAITNMMQGVNQILGDMGSVTSNMDTVLNDVDYMRNFGIPGLSADIGAMSNRLETAITDVRDDVIDAVVTNTTILGTLSTNVTALTNVLSGVIAPAVTSTWNQVSEIATNVMTDVSRILTRPSTVEQGSTVKILYKTRPNLVGVNLGVSPSGYSGGMTPIVAGSGIYEEDVTFSWGVGTYVVSCTDPNGSDSMVIEVIATAADEAPGLIAGVSNMLNTIAADVTALSSLSALTNSMNDLQSVVTNLAGVDLSGVMTELSNIDSDLSTIKSDVASLDTSSMESSLNEVSSSMSEVRTSMTEVKTAVNSLDLTQLDQIVTVANQLSTVASDSSSAAQDARQAKTAAQEAADGITALNEALAVEDVDQSLEAIAQVRQALTQAQDSITSMSDTVGLSLGGRMNDMLTMLKQMSETEGFEAVAQSTEKLIEKGASGDLDGMNRTLQEARGKIIHMEKLLEETANQPIVTEMLIGE
ncbi:hypothetical protein BVX97_00775 [bacterium E08(2017)]|nr:hypothetical protein BVX97_00775 [bacterium E08(2017)]